MRGRKQQMSLEISRALLEETIAELRASPDKEKVILWLGKRGTSEYVVDDIFTPIQITDEDFFRIPEEGMNQLMSHLRNVRKMIVAQIHTHPREAFHSNADDRWAIVRHAGAYSLVLPEFCSTTEKNNFLEMVATFVLNKSNKWKRVSSSNITIV